MRQTAKITEAQMTLDQKWNPAKWIAFLVGQLQSLFFSLVGSFTPGQARKVVILGQGPFSQALARFFNSEKAFGYQFMGFFDTPNREAGFRGDVAALKRFCLEEEIDEIYFTGTSGQEAIIEDIARFADQHFMYFRLAADSELLAQKAGQVNTYYFDEVPVMGLRREPLASRFNQALKRAFDIVFSLGVLAILVPFVFPIIALAIRWESKGPIFFLQDRPGKKNKLFKCYKFRSMRVNNEGHKQATKNDARITKVGAFLRKTSLDELPQFINVLLGDMSVVGPRPNMIKQLEYYSQHIENYSFRHFVTPGITGYAQVNGFRGETKTIELMEKRVEYDIEYMKRWSLWFDIQIIFKTAWNMVKGEDMAY